MNKRFQAVLQGETTPIPPIWMMRQAGRYHKHYQNLRKSYSFIDLCKKPRLAAETALGPVMDFDFDLAILFSDLLFPLEALGMDLTYENGGPELNHGLDAEKIQNFRTLEAALPFLAFQKEAVSETRKVLPSDKSLIGFIGGPWTLFVYAMEGSHKGHLIDSKRHLYDLFPLFCQHLVPLLKANIELQLSGGAEAVMILDTAAGELSPGDYLHFLAGPTAELLSSGNGSVGYYAKAATADHFKALKFRLSQHGTAANLKPLGIGVDHRFQLSTLLESQDYRFVQGNFDQIQLHLQSLDFESNLRNFLGPLQKLTPIQRRGWICGVGHGLIPSTPEANVKRFVQIVREVFS